MTVKGMAKYLIVEFYGETEIDTAYSDGSIDANDKIVEDFLFVKRLAIKCGYILLKQRKYDFSFSALKSAIEDTLMGDVFDKN